MNKIIILGAGMVGSAIAIDLAKNHDITLTDIDSGRLKYINSNHQNIAIKALDVTNHEDLSQEIVKYDLVVCAVPGFLGFKTLKCIIESKMNVIDISFFPEDSLELDQLAKENNVTAIVDCGVAPGMDNIILGYYNEKLQISHFECLVGGLPKIKKWPFCYKAPFSPMDVIEEYTRPARYVENGSLVIKEALSDCEYREFDHIGTLEAFNSDGLRSIIKTMPHIPNMIEKTLRYPGHVEYIKVLKESGFFSEDKISVDGHEISPLDFTSKLLFKEWYLDEKEEEFTVMRVSITGQNEDGKTELIIYDLFDQYCTKTSTASMSRTTGYTATAAVNLFLEGLFTKKGVYPPELIGGHGDCFNFILNYLKERNVIYKRTKTIV